jgi:hypothetical protein
MSVHEDRAVSLADYRGKHPLVLGLFRGVYCAFCGRAVTRLALTGEKLRELGIGTLAVLATTLDNARLYFRYHPVRIPIAVGEFLIDQAGVVRWMGVEGATPAEYKQRPPSEEGLLAAVRAL